MHIIIIQWNLTNPNPWNAGHLVLTDILLKYGIFPIHYCNWINTPKSRKPGGKVYDLSFGMYFLYTWCTREWCNRFGLTPNCRDSIINHMFRNTFPMHDNLIIRASSVRWWDTVPPRLLMYATAVVLSNCRSTDTLLLSLRKDFIPRKAPASWCVPVLPGMTKDRLSWFPDRWPPSPSGMHPSWWSLWVWGWSVLFHSTGGGGRSTTGAPPLPLLSGPGEHCNPDRDGLGPAQATNHDSRRVKESVAVQYCVCRGCLNTLTRRWFCARAVSLKQLLMFGMQDQSRGWVRYVSTVHWSCYYHNHKFIFHVVSKVISVAITARERWVSMCKI